MKKILLCGLTLVSLLATSCSNEPTKCSKEDVVAAIKANSQNEVPDFTTVTYSLKIDTLKITGDNKTLVAKVEAELEGLQVNLGEEYEDLELKEGATASYSISFSESGLEGEKMTESSLELLGDATFYKGNGIYGVSYTISSDLGNGNEMTLTTYAYYNEYNLPDSGAVDVSLKMTQDNDTVSLDYKVSVSIEYKWFILKEP